MSEKLEDIAKAMVQPGQGILAADESTGTIKKRFDSINVESTEDNRRDYREMLFRADDAMKNHISGVILFDETLRQKAKDGTPLVDLIKAVRRCPRHQGRRRRQGLSPARTASRTSPKASTACASACRNITSSAPASPSGAPSSPSATPCRPITASTPTPTASPVTQRFARKTASCPSSSRKSSWMVSIQPTPSTNATASPSGP